MEDELPFGVSDEDDEDLFEEDEDEEDEDLDDATELD